jgi:signal transduction histidine kinase
MTPKALRSWLWSWFAGRVAGRDRTVLLAGITIRVAAAVMVSYAVPLVWAHLPRPGWSALLAVAVVAENAVITGWWLHQRRVSPAPLAVDLPFGVLVLFAGNTLDATVGEVGWTSFAFPYTVLMAFTLGLATRRLWPAVLAGQVWTAAFAASSVLLEHNRLSRALLVFPAYLIGPLVGWVGAKMSRRASDELDAVRVIEVGQASALATAAERSRHARALHDRVLQTMETLARGQTVAGEALRARVVEQAGWLRRFVETGRADQEDDLAAGLAAATRAATRTGAEVQLNDARLRTGEPSAELGTAQRETLVQAVHQAIAAITGTASGVVVRATPEGDGVLVTVLATGPAHAPDPDEVAELSARLSTVGGSLVVEPVPYVELWVPAGRTAAAEPA